MRVQRSGVVWVASLVFTAWMGPVAADAARDARLKDLTRRQLALFETYHKASGTKGLSIHEYWMASASLKACKDRIAGDPVQLCTEAQQAVDTCNAYRDRWYQERTAVFDELKSLGEPVPEYGLIRADLPPCPWTLPDSWDTPADAIRKWQAQQSGQPEPRKEVADYLDVPPEGSTQPENGQAAGPGPAASSPETPNPSGSGSMAPLDGLVAFYEYACSTQLRAMRSEWNSQGMNGVTEWAYYESVAKMDAAALQQKVWNNGGHTPGILARHSGAPTYDRTNDWEDCLLRTRAAQLGISLAGLDSPAGGAGTDPSGTPEDGVSGEEAGDNAGAIPANELWGKTAPDGSMSEENLARLVTNCTVLREGAIQDSSGDPYHHPPAEATNCVKPRGDIPPNGGFFNDCDFEVEVAWCLYRPFANTMGTAIDCEQNRKQVRRVPPHQGREALVTDAELIYYVACSRPGSSVVEMGPFVSGQGPQLRCQAWSDGIDPAAREPYYGGDCSIEALERFSGINFPEPAAPVPQPYPDSGSFTQDPAGSNPYGSYSDPGTGSQPGAAWNDPYAAAPGYDPNAYPPDQGNDTGQAVVDAALQLMQMYLQMQNQGNGSGGYSDGSGEEDGDENCWDLEGGGGGVCQ